MSVYSQATDRWNAKRHAEALTLVEQACAMDSSGLSADLRTAAPLLRSKILTQLKRYDDAIDAIEQTRSYIPSGRLHEALADVYFQKQDFRQALAHGRDFIDGGGKPTVAIYYMIAASLDKLGEVDQAAEWMARGRAEFPNSEAIKNWGAVYARQARSERGLITQDDGRFVLRFADLPDQAETRIRALRALGSALTAVCNVYGFQPRAALPVVLYASTSDYYAASGVPQWSGGCFDGKVRVPLALHARTGLDSVASHEIAHYVIGELSANRAPAWLNEGLAQIAEGRDERWATAVLARHSARFTLAQLEQGFHGITDPERALVAYAQALIKTRRLVDLVGMGRIRPILEQLARGQRMEEIIDMR